MGRPPRLVKEAKAKEEEEDIMEVEDHGGGGSNDLGVSWKTSSSYKKKNWTEMVQLLEGNVYRPMVDLSKRNIVKELDSIYYGRTSEFLAKTKSVEKTLVRRHVDHLKRTYHGKLNRRITSLTWHPIRPHFVAAASKGGDISVVLGSNTSDAHTINFQEVVSIDGPGPGGSILSLKFTENDNENIYVATMEGTVTRIGIESEVKTFVYHNTGDYFTWFTSMDVSRSTGTILAGDTKGNALLFTIHGESVSNVRLHRGKILHCEFNPKVPNLIATSSLDHTVKLWDLRKLTPDQALAEFTLEKGCNIARFNPKDGSRLLVNDQADEIRLYQGPLWHEYLRIEHPHRQFQHLTPIKASWHPLTDYIVIGRYPKVEKGTRAPPRPLDFFDADTGKLVYELESPENQIICLNEFNHTGDCVVTGAGMNFHVWQSLDGFEQFREQENERYPALQPNVSREMRNILRGRPRDHDSSSDDEDDLKKRRKKMPKLVKEKETKTSKGKPRKK